MTMHYHGLPITPVAELQRMKGENFCVSFARPAQCGRAHEIAQSVMLDNGAFTFWQRGQGGGRDWWNRYYGWCEEFLVHRTTWAVIPDSITGDAEDNDYLIRQWPFGDRGAPVWHLHEPIRRLLDLCYRWPRVCIGSSGRYARVGTPEWHERMERAFNALCAPYSPPPVDLHMLRGLSLVKPGNPYPFTSVDSSAVSRNYKDHAHQWTIEEEARRWNAMQCPAVWVPTTHRSQERTNGTVPSSSRRSATRAGAS